MINFIICDFTGNFSEDAHIFYKELCETGSDYDCLAFNCYLIRNLLIMSRPILYFVSCSYEIDKVDTLGTSVQ